MEYSFIVRHYFFAIGFHWCNTETVDENNIFQNKSKPPYRASDISRGREPAKFRYFREIPRNSQKNAKYREIRQKYFQIHVGKTYLILILAIRPVLFTPNVQI